MKALLLFNLSFVITLFLLPALSLSAVKAGLVDVPDRRKIHQGPVPVVGGIGIMAAVLLCSVPFTDHSSLGGLYAGLVLLLAAGYLDDKRGLSSGEKFAAQVGACLFMIFGGAMLHGFGDLLALGAISFGSMAAPVTVFCTLGVINALNMIDGLDGLAGGISLVALLSFAFLAFLDNQTELLLISLVSAGAVLGFLGYNLNPARLFMGDSGSLTLGFLMAFLSIALTRGGYGKVPPVVPLLVLAVPIADCLSVMLRRALNRHALFYARKDHFHHLLLAAGLDQKSAVAVMLGLSALLASFAIIGTVLAAPAHYLFLLFLLYFSLHLSISLLMEKSPRSLRHLPLKLVRILLGRW